MGLNNNKAPKEIRFFSSAAGSKTQPYRMPGQTQPSQNQLLTIKTMLSNFALE
jgi:hypothetical protein